MVEHEHVPGHRDVLNLIGDVPAQHADEEQQSVSRDGHPRAFRAGGAGPL
jgi:hypothetical protein